MKLKNAPARKLARQQKAGPDTHLKRSERKPNIVSRTEQAAALESARNSRSKIRRVA